MIILVQLQAPCRLAASRYSIALDAQELSKDGDVSDMKHQCMPARLGTVLSNVAVCRLCCSTAAHQWAVSASSGFIYCYFRLSQW